MEKINKYYLFLFILITHLVFILILLLLEFINHLITFWMNQNFKYINEIFFIFQIILFLILIILLIFIFLPRYFAPKLKLMNKLYKIFSIITLILCLMNKILNFYNHKIFSEFYDNCPFHLNLNISEIQNEKYKRKCIYINEDIISTNISMINYVCLYNPAQNIKLQKNKIIKTLLSKNLKECKLNQKIENNNNNTNNIFNNINEKSIFYNNFELIKKYKDINYYICNKQYSNKENKLINKYSKFKCPDFKFINFRFYLIISCFILNFINLILFILEINGLKKYVIPLAITKYNDLIDEEKYINKKKFNFNKNIYVTEANPANIKESINNF